MKAKRMVISLFTGVFLAAFISSAIAAKPAPDEVIKMLSQGNARFVAGRSLHPHTDINRLHQAGTENQGNHAYATVISCSDSRVPVERIFDSGVMDVFVIRVAGNVVDVDEAGSIEYGLAHVNTPVLVVLGHKQCGAVTAVTHAVHGKGHALEINIPPLVDNIFPAVKRAMSLHPSVHGDAIIPHAIEENVWQGIEDLFMRSPTARNMVRQGKAKVVGAIYDVGTGRVDWMPQAPVMKILNAVEHNPARQMKAMAGEGHKSESAHGKGHDASESNAVGQGHGKVEPVKVTLADAATMALLNTDWLKNTDDSHFQEIKPKLSGLIWAFGVLLAAGFGIVIFVSVTGMFKRFSLNMKLYTSYGSLVFLAVILGLGGYLYLERVNGAAHQETAFLELDMMANEIEAFQNVYLLHGIENKAYGEKKVKEIKELVAEFNEDFTRIKEQGHLNQHQVNGVNSMASKTTAYAKDFKRMESAYHEIEEGKDVLDELTGKMDKALEQMIHHHEAELADLEAKGSDMASIQRQTTLLYHLNEAEVYSLKLAKEEVEFLLDKHADRVGHMEEHMGHMMGYLKALENELESEKEKKLLHDVEEEIKAYQALLIKVIKDEAEILKLTAETAGLLHGIASIGEGLSHNAKLMAAGMQKEGDIALISLIVIAVVSGSLLSFFISRGISNPINGIIKGMREGANQVASASNQVSSSSQSMAEGSSEQAASIEETSSSMEEMSSMTKKNAESAGHANTLMKEAHQVVSATSEAMEKLTGSMADISKASDETSKIIKTIDEIAFQTNLLALNAAVEAARAGEAGAGFAVVADEVRNLAMRAADAAKDTAELIEGTIKKVNDGSELVSNTNEAFVKVTQSAGKVGELVAEISEASSEQSNGIEQVNCAISEMDKVVQGNAANAEESAAAAEELNAQAEQLRDFVGDLVKLITGKKDLGDVDAVHHAVHKEVQAEKKNRGLLQHKAEVTPEQVIPFDEDEDFKDF